MYFGLHFRLIQRDCKMRRKLMGMIWKKLGSAFRRGLQDGAGGTTAPPGDNHLTATDRLRCGRKAGSRAWEEEAAQTPGPCRGRCGQDAPSFHRFPPCPCAQCWEGQVAKNKNSTVATKQAVLASNAWGRRRPVEFFSRKENRCTIHWLPEVLPGA